MLLLVYGLNKRSCSQAPFRLSVWITQWGAFNQPNAQEAGEGILSQRSAWAICQGPISKNLLTEKGQRGYELEGSLLIGNVNPFSETASSWEEFWMEMEGEN